MTHSEILEEAIGLGSVCEINEWMELKKLLLVSLPSDARRNFSTRDPKTKRQHLNDFEHWLIDNYFRALGTKLGVEDE